MMMVCRAREPAQRSEPARVHAPASMLCQLQERGARLPKLVLQLGENGEHGQGTEQTTALGIDDGHAHQAAAQQHQG